LEKIIHNFFYIFIAFIIALDGVLQGYKIFGIDLFRLLQFVSFLFLAKHFFKTINNNLFLKELFKFIIILVFFLSLKMFTIIFILDSGVEFSTFHDLLRLLLYLIFLYITYYIINKNPKYIKLILFFNLPVMLIAFFQYQLFPFNDFFWDLRFHYFNFSHVNFLGAETLETNLSFRQRVVGLYATSIPIAYILVTNMLITLYIYIKEKKIFYFFLFLFYGVISLFTLTRSVVLSFIILLIYIILKNIYTAPILNKLISIILVTSISFSAGYLYTSTRGSLDRLSNVTGTSASGRGPLAITGAVAIIEYPFGISKEKYNKVKEEMYNILHHPNVLKFPSHNGLLNIGFTYTTFGLLYFIFFIYKIKKILYKNLSKEMRNFFTIAIFAYLANGLLHNNFIFIQDFYILIFIAIIAYEYKITLLKKVLNNEEN